VPPNQVIGGTREGQAIEISDLSAPLATSEKERGLQIIISPPSSIGNSLSREAAARLQAVAQAFLQGLLLEAQRLAAVDSEDLGVNISSKHIVQAEVIEKKRRSLTRDRWSYIRDVALAGVGAGLGNIAHPPLALALIILFGFFFVISKSRA